MPTGLAFPMDADENGRMATVTGDANDAKIIILALLDGDNDNAFQQDLALGQFMIFDMQDETIRAKITMKIVAIFEKFEKAKRFKLFADTLTWEEDSKEQTLSLSFKYLNLETDEPQTFAYTFGG